MATGFTQLLRLCIPLLTLFAASSAHISPGNKRTTTHLTSAERKVVHAAFDNVPADFTGWNREERTIRSSVVEDLFAEEKRKKLNRLGFTIKNAIFQGPLNLGSVQVPVTLRWEDCEFTDQVTFSSSHFFAPLYLTGSKFTNGHSKVTFNNTQVDDLLDINRVFVAGGAEFFRLGVAGDLFASEAKFTNKLGEIRFDEAIVRGKMYFGLATQDSVTFKPSRFEGSLSLADIKTLELDLSGVRVRKKLNLSHADIQTVLNLDVGCIGHIGQACNIPPTKLCLPETIRLEGLSYRDIQSGVGCQLRTLIDHAEGYSARSYTQLEEYYRTHAEPEEADAVFFHMKGEERERLRGLSKLWNWIIRGLVGYGRYPENALYYSFAFVLLGTLIFRNRRNMEPREKDSSLEAYSSFWYSFDLLTPFIDLHLADSWMPRQDWRLGRFYAHVHRILGWILVPIGIAAITGVIK